MLPEQQKERITYYVQQYQEGKIDMKTLYEKIIEKGVCMKKETIKEKLGKLQIQRDDIETEIDAHMQEVNKLRTMLQGVEELERNYRGMLMDGEE